MVKLLLKTSLILGIAFCFGCSKDRSFQKKEADHFYLPTGAYSDRPDAYYKVYRKDTTVEIDYFQMQIYNEGLKLYECDTSEAFCTWDGSYNDTFVDEGQYFCKIKYRLQETNRTYHAETHFELRYYD